MKKPSIEEILLYGSLIIGSSFINAVIKEQERIAEFQLYQKKLETAKALGFNQVVILP